MTEQNKNNEIDSPKDKLAKSHEELLKQAVRIGRMMEGGILNWRNPQVSQALDKLGELRVARSKLYSQSQPKTVQKDHTESLGLNAGLRGH